jgi:hypothetical protein
MFKKICALLMGNKQLAPEPIAPPKKKPTIRKVAAKTVAKKTAKPIAKKTAKKIVAVKTKRG